MDNEEITLYLKKSLYEGRTVRWVKNEVSVFCDFSNLGLYTDKDFYIKATQKAFEEWEAAINCNKIKFVQVGDRTDADIIYMFQRANYENDIGLCQYRFNNKNELTGAIITVGLIYKHLIYQIMLHEVGHAIGICGHSPHAKDVMHAYSNRNDVLTDNDRKIINTIYSLPVATTIEEILRIFHKNHNPCLNLQKNSTDTENNNSKNLINELNLIGKLKLCALKIQNYV